MKAEVGPEGDNQPVIRPSKTNNARPFSLWSFLRNVLHQGEAIGLDCRERPYEEYSARMDAAARERETQLRETLILSGETRECHIRPHDFCSASTCAICVDAARYVILRDYIEPRVLHDKLVRDGKPLGTWRDLPITQTIREKIDELCDSVLTHAPKASEQYTNEFIPPAPILPERFNSVSRPKASEQCPAVNVPHKAASPDARGIPAGHCIYCGIALSEEVGNANG